jgi:hypothetical protein
MAAADFRYYFVVQNTRAVRAKYASRDEIKRALLQSVPNLPSDSVIDCPSLSWTKTPGKPPQDGNLVIAVTAPGLKEPPIIVPSRRGLRILNHGANPGGASADHWCPVLPDGGQFGTRTEARRLINAGVLGQSPYSGAGVNVVLIDRGLNQKWIEDCFGKGRYGGGWPYLARAGDPRPTQLPGQTAVADAHHGLMLARNILDLAPEAVLWDMPLLPPRIFDIQLFLSEAEAAFDWMLQDIYSRGGTWILVNAWAIYDRVSETPFGDYTENRRSTLHPFTTLVDEAIDHGLDVIFCAGNCGEFCPSQRCGPLDQGPGNSIWGANSYCRVISVGAVRTDATWIGYSSEGPGQPRLGKPPGTGVNPKPDLCAPSGFCENFDANSLNSGTSAATGVTAGVVAALRSNWNSTAVPPDQLLTILNATARQPSPGGWNQRFGNGIINVEAALAALP